MKCDIYYFVFNDLEMYIVSIVPQRIALDTIKKYTSALYHKDDKNATIYNARTYYTIA